MSSTPLPLPASGPPVVAVSDLAGTALSEQSWNPGAMTLGETIRALAHSLMGHTSAATSAADETWRTRLRGLLSPLRQAFAEHRTATEGDNGFYAEVVQDAPRLAPAVHGLVAEHHSLDTAMARLANVADEASSDAETLRRNALQVLDDLTRHRQHDADLVYDAYTTDLGGE